MRYEDCAICQERYWDDDIRRYMHELPSGDHVCRHHKEEEIETMLAQS